MLWNAIAEEITGGCHGWCLGLSVGRGRGGGGRVSVYEKCCCFPTSHGTSYGKEKEHASALRLNDQRTWFKGCRGVPERRVERVEGSRHTDELMGNLLVMVESVWISMRVSACGRSMTDKVCWAGWSWFSHAACHGVLPVKPINGGKKLKKTVFLPWLWSVKRKNCLITDGWERTEGVWWNFTSLFSLRDAEPWW